MDCAAISGHFSGHLKVQKGLFGNVWMLFQYLENVYICKSNNTLNFVGAAATDAHFEVTLKCKIGLFGNFF